VIFLLLGVGLLLLKRAPKASRAILWSSLFVGYLLSTPMVANFLHHSLEFHPALQPVDIANHNASAIVVLSSGRYKDAPEYGGDTLGKETLVRVRYGAYLHRQTDLPIIVSGGIVHSDEGKTLAQVMADSLANDFGINDVLLEGQSRTTGENALYTKQLLDELGMHRIFLVTSSSHMARSVASFEQQGIEVIPAPTAFKRSDDPWMFQIMPSAYYLYETRVALHEWLGMLWYKIRY
jgi:uncharacterized SAM-binding protein YcdF (DUF218 family)